jgi:hypothetical protein
MCSDFPALVARYERERFGVRWVWESTAQVYPALLHAGVRVRRCHDLRLAERLLLGRDGHPGAAASLAAAYARLTGDRAAGHRDGGAVADPEPATVAASPEDGRAPPLAARDSPPPGALAASSGAPVAALSLAAAAVGGQESLFGDADIGRSGGPVPAPDEVLAAVAAVHADQRRRIAADQMPAKFQTLVAAESAGALAAEEMRAVGLPWRADVHKALLAELLGPRPASRSAGSRPARLAALASQISAAFGHRPVNPDSPAQIVRAFAAAGIRVPSARAAVLCEIDHPAVPLLLQYKELSRLHAAFGWHWLDTWVSAGRFRPEYMVGGVVSGRWASSGGGALQIPRLLRRAVVADPGWTLVVADAAQLEPRVLAALAGDESFARAAAADDLYEALAAPLGGDRSKAKIALLSAMYGGAAGEAAQFLAMLRRRFPRAAGFVERAAQAGEEGRVVRSALGRTCPPPSPSWQVVTEEAAGPGMQRDPRAGQAARARGRFTRNFVVQASAADFALVLLAALRSRLGHCGGADGDAELVFFQHDEVIVHCRQPAAESVVAAAAEAADEAGRTVFGQTPVRFPMTTTVVNCYADAK